MRIYNSRIVSCSVFVAWLLVFLTPSWAATLGGVELSDDTIVDGKRLVLNGVGLREATIFKVDVYVMGLYLEQKSQDPTEILNSTGLKKIVMHFVRKVGASDLKGAWQTGFEANGQDTGVFKNEIATLEDVMGDMKVGDTMVFDFVSDHVDVFVRDQKKATIAGAAFQRALLSVWLGPSPPNPEIKHGVLGK